MPEKIKYYCDENVSSAIVHGLRIRGVEVLTVQEARMLGASDEAHLEFATQRSLVLFTQDADFLRLHALGIMHSGIAYAHQRMLIGDIIRGLVLVYELLDAKEVKRILKCSLPLVYKMAERGQIPCVRWQCPGNGTWCRGNGV